jgi:hypothetical protein
MLQHHSTGISLPVNKEEHLPCCRGEERPQVRGLATFYDVIKLGNQRGFEGTVRRA